MSPLMRIAAVLLPVALCTTACDSDDPSGTGDTEGSGDTDGADESTGVANLPDGCNYYVEAPSETAQDELITALVDVQPMETVCVGPGTFTITRQLTITADDVTLRGAGQDDTVFDFSNQNSGGNGILIEGDRTTIDSLTVVETPGDGIRANDVDGVRFLNVTVGWAAEADETNGAYALYPVQSENVIIDGCVVYGAADAGVYLGQSGKSLIENSEAYGNVIGIEVENSTDVVVRNNNAHDNTNGILVITLPGLDILDGKRANVYDNIVENNNLVNFGDPGTTVGLIPPGVGVLLVATDTNEIWNNTITGNKSAAVAMIGFLDSLFGAANDPDFDIYSEGNNIHSNTISGNAEDPDQLVLVLNGNAAPGPEIIVGGCFDPEKDQSDEALANCFAVEESQFFNADACQQNGGTNTDIAPYTCTQPALPTDSPVDPF
ncbi:MAG: parallel beta-helix domain-containing protein [Myxococcota bacterium]